MIISTLITTWLTTSHVVMSVDTVQQMTRLITKAISDFDHQKVNVVTILDVAKTFDRVWIDSLIY